MKESHWFWNFVAKRYDRHSHADKGYDRAIERFAEYLQPDDTVLDYACATGVIAFKVATRVKLVHAIDTSAKMIELGQKRVRESKTTNVIFERRSLFDEELITASYDAVLAFNILHLLEDARHAVGRAVDLLKPGGILVSSTPCLGDAGLFLRSLPPLISKLGVLSYLRRLNGTTVKAMQLDAGLEVLTHVRRDESIPIFFAVARKPCG